MKCPKCGYQRQERDDAFVPATECPSCGVVYSKHESGVLPVAPMPTVAQSPHLRNSPVSPDSLKKARDRVEKRLRSRLETRVRDERHEQTLELARKLTSEEIRKRQEQTAKRDQEEADVTALKEQISESMDSEAQTSEEILLEEKIDALTDIDGQNEVEATETAQAEADDQGIDDPSETEGRDAIPESDSEPQEAAANDGTDAEIPQKHEYPEDIEVKTIRLTDGMADSDDTQEDADAPREKYAFMDDDEDELPPAHIAAGSGPAKVSGFGPGLMRLLPFVAWLILLAGVVGAVLSWTTISDVEAGVRIPMSAGQSTLPIGLLLGFAYLATGALGFAFFWVASLISRQLKDIRQLLLVHPISMMPDEKGRE